jgi:hypothetical protein
VLDVLGPVRAIWYPWLLQHIGAGIRSDLRGKQLMLLDGIHVRLIWEIELLQFIFNLWGSNFSLPKSGCLLPG